MNAEIKLYAKQIAKKKRKTQSRESTELLNREMDVIVVNYVENVERNGSKKREDKIDDVSFVWSLGI